MAKWSISGKKAPEKIEIKSRIENPLSKEKISRKRNGKAK